MEMRVEIRWPFIGPIEPWTQALNRRLAEQYRQMADDVSEFMNRLYGHAK